MNYYERIQNAIFFIEERLGRTIVIEEAAKAAFMSRAGFYRMFFAFTGHSVKEYIRNRRISIAADILLTGNCTILDLALKYGFESHESFTRAFKKKTGVTPASFRKKRICYSFKRMDIMEKYFDVQDRELLEKYPEIKVLKEINSVRVASFQYTGEEPEDHAWNIMSDWFLKSGLNVEKDNIRIFGFNNPEPSGEDEEYGYEFWITISDEYELKDPRIKSKIFNGGLYAVTTVKNGPENLPSAWKRLMSWLKDSKYKTGHHQWLEEHLNPGQELNFTGDFDIYMPIEK